MFEFLEPAMGGMPRLETQRLTLRKAAMSDAADLYEYGRDPRVAEHVLWEAYQSIHEARAYVRYLQRQYRSQAPSSWCIEHKESGKVIGTIGLMWWNQEHQSAEIGYSLSRAYWNQGLMTEALVEVIRYCFEELNLHRLEAQHECSNPASGRVMEKVGMQREGLLRGRLRNKGRYVDVYLYAILREDWTARTRLQTR